MALYRASIWFVLLPLHHGRGRAVAHHRDSVTSTAPAKAQGVTEVTAELGERLRAR